MRRKIALGFAVLAALPVVWAVGGSLLASAWQRSADQGWAQAGEPMDALVSAHPPTTDSAAARELDELAGRIGIRLGSEEAPSYARLTADERKAFEGLLKKVGSFVSEQAARGDEALAAPPAEVAELLARHADLIAAIEAQIVNGGTLVWESDLSKGFRAPTPRLLGHRLLQNLLLAQAVSAAPRGEPRRAEQALEAAWRARASLVSRPDLLSQLVGMAQAFAQNGVLRRIPSVPGVWQERVTAHDLRRAIPRALQLEAWLFGDLARGSKGLGDLAELENPDPPQRKGLWPPLDRALTAPYLRLCVADYSSRLREATLEMRKQDPCAFDGDAFEVRTKAVPGWNFIGRIAIGSLARTWGSVGHSALDAELTRRVLEAKAERSAGRLRPRPSVASAVCGSVHWIEEQDADGGLTIRADRNPFPKGSHSSTLSFSLRPGSGGLTGRTAAVPLR